MIFYRREPPEVQEAIAMRLVKKVDQLNLFLDTDVTWGVDVRVIPRLKSVPRGFTRFQFRDQPVIRFLNLPALALVHGTDLLLLSTGPWH